MDTRRFVAYSEPIATRIRTALVPAHRTGEKEDVRRAGLSLPGEDAHRGLGQKVIARCRPEDQPGLLKPPHVTPMNFTGRVMKGWLYVTSPSTKKVAGLRTWIARGETALRAPTRKPGRGTR